MSLNFIWEFSERFAMWSTGTPVSDWRKQCTGKPNQTPSNARTLIYIHTFIIATSNLLHFNFFIFAFQKVSSFICVCSTLFSYWMQKFKWLFSTLNGFIWLFTDINSCQCIVDCKRLWYNSKCCCHWIVEWNVLTIEFTAFGRERERERKRRKDTVNC